ncbi:magnesium transporter CorA family protein [Frigoribacterium sp. CFBP 13712]|uniref:magnesium transporter CorA family protein n=1 Tax=Frigoribacterium sp. CFBP 13712 TaxID=2775309 RepID=UPI0017851819|nr:magnesium transporter CorA family protein [Frigoribacterium sp. CFBP 13712]MBD8702425.1 magnesium transporter CorA family protein [Frigoribacterium sp. CFBP 13712]
MTDTRPARTSSSSTATVTRAYRGGELIAHGFPLAEVSDHLEDADCIVWVDFTDPSPADLAELEDELGLHELAVEDALHDGQRPKIDRYDGHLFTALYDVDFDRDSGVLSTSEVKAFVTARALVTIHHPEFDVSRLERTYDDNVDLTTHGVTYLLWGLLDSVVDRHFDATDALDDEIEGIADDLFDPKPRTLDVQKRSFALRKSLVQLRRVSSPMREVLNTLLRRDLKEVDAEMQPYFQDVYDHVLRVSEQNDSLRDLVSTILDTNLNLQSNRMNLIMKKVTSWAAIIAVPTAITGFYGQNVPYPGFQSTTGFITSCVLIVAIGGVLWWQFRRRDWL